MGIIFYRGQQLGPDDIAIYFKGNNGNPTNAADIYYAIFDYTTGLEALVGSSVRTPANPSIGSYYANITIPLDANIGSYRVRWYFKETVNGPEHQVVQEFEVYDKSNSTITSGYTPCETGMIRSLRILLRDNNPDRNYHFRPPAHEETINQFNRVFGYIWEDEELLEYITRSLDMVSLAPPFFPFANVDSLCSIQYSPWKTLVLQGAMIHALQALRLNWVADEFSYSIGGVSLDIEKSSKYADALATASDQFDKQLEKAKATVKFTKGLQQPRFGIGIRSSFGPYMGRGVLSPRKFIGF